MEKTSDTTTFLIIGIVCGVIFVVLFILMVIVTFKSRAATRKRLEAAFDFASVINKDETKDFYYLNSLLVDADGKPVEIPAGIRAYELIFSGFVFGSQTPQYCCRVAVDDVQMKNDEFGRCFGDEPIQFFLRPAKNTPGQWTVVNVSDRHVTCEHPVMGKLELPKESCPHAVSGSKIRLVPTVRKTPAGYLLQYTCQA